MPGVISSAVEYLVYTERVSGSNPLLPTWAGRQKSAVPPRALSLLRYPRLLRPKKIFSAGWVARLREPPFKGCIPRTKQPFKSKASGGAKGSWRSPLPPQKGAVGLPPLPKVDPLAEGCRRSTFQGRGGRETFGQRADLRR